jgi:hypothetical protein
LSTSRTKELELADFTWTHAITYNAGALVGPQTHIGGGELITDGDADTTFESGDMITASGQPYTYAGTMMVDGIDWPVFSWNTDPNYVTVFMNQEPVSIPGTLSVTAQSIAVCFCAGTMIRTPNGETMVEALHSGDKVLTEEARAVTVKWIGRQTVSTRFGPADRLEPVRFTAGSLGEGLPHSDLTVTTDHGMLVNGVICHAGALVNGTTITRVPLAEMGDTYTVYHIETEEHEIILANGAPAETFIDNVSRRVFDNYAEFEALYGDVPEMEELPFPRAMSARQVPPHVLARLAGKAAA